MPLCISSLKESFWLVSYVSILYFLILIFNQLSWFFWDKEYLRRSKRWISSKGVKGIWIEIGHCKVKNDESCNINVNKLFFKCSIIFSSFKILKFFENMYLTFLIHVIHKWIYKTFNSISVPIINFLCLILRLLISSFILIVSVMKLELNSSIHDLLYK